MPMDLVVVGRQRQHIGGNEGLFEGIEPGVTFVGAERIFNFDCPNIDSTAEAVLLFQSLGVDFRNNLIQFNGIENSVFGGIPFNTVPVIIPATGAVINNMGGWNGNVMIITPNVLRETGNQLQIQARNAQGADAANRDDFIIDNIIILYRTR